MAKFSDQLKEEVFINFVVNAQNQILTGKGKRIPTALSQFSRWDYSEDNLTCRMYRTGHAAPHEIIEVLENNQLVWMSHLTGMMVEKTKKEVLRGVNKMLSKIISVDDPSIKSFRGPNKVILGKWEYRYKQAGKVNFFHGAEWLIHNKKTVYRANIVGGFVRGKRILEGN